MVSDASSGDSRRTELERDKAPVKSGLDGHSRTTADLTHELAQLLAATIAQRQLSNGLPATAQPALNLAGLSTQQRMLEPTFKDGLSALSYKAPRGTSLVPSVDLSADDEPMPIPSTWREPAGADSDRWLRQQMGATLLGLCAGLLVVVPIVLWLSGWLGDAQKSRPGRSAEPSIAPIEPRSGEVKTVKVQVRPVERAPQAAAQYITGNLDARVAAEPPRPVEQTASAAGGQGSRAGRTARTGAPGGRPPGRGKAADRERRCFRGTRYSNRRGRQCAWADLICAGRDLRSQYVGGLGHARSHRRCGKGQGALPQITRSGDGESPGAFGSPPVACRPLGKSGPRKVRPPESQAVTGST